MPTRYHPLMLASAPIVLPSDNQWGLGAGDLRNQRAMARHGLQGHQVPQSGLRAGSFAHLRAGGAVHGGGIKIGMQPNGQAHIIDGRHRITIAREQGHTTVQARVYGQGPRGGVRWVRDMKVKI